MFSGIGGYDLSSTNDQVFAFDYDSSGRLDHLALYRPGSGIFWIVRKDAAGNFGPVFASATGIGSYDLTSPNDRAFACDYDGSGKLDHLVLYRPGTGIIFILNNNGGNFGPVFKSATGIGSYDLTSPNDRAFGCDYDGSGKLDHLVLYRPGTGIIFILNNNGGNFGPVFKSATGIGSYDLTSPNDRAFVCDYDGSGKLDHLVLYRPGTGIIFILNNNGGNFGPVLTSTAGIGGYDLGSTDDRAFAFDYDSSGRLDHLALYRPGSGIFWIIRKDAAGNFSDVYASNAMVPPVQGIGGCDFGSTDDIAFAFDYDSSGRLDHLAAYRPGTGMISILNKSAAGIFQPVYTAHELPAPPTNLTVQGVSTTGIAIVWQNTISSATAIDVQRATGSSPFMHVTTVAGAATHYLDSGLSPNTVYSYRLQALTPYGPSAWSSVLTTQTESDQPAITSISANPQPIQVCFPQAITVSWSVEHTQHVQLTRGGITIATQTAPGGQAGAWSSSAQDPVVQTDSVAYTLTAVGQTGKQAQQSLTVPIGSAWPLIRSITLANESNIGVELAFYSAQDLVVQDLGALPAKISKMITIPECSIVNLKAAYVDVDGVTQVPWESRLILGNTKYGQAYSFSFA